MATKPLEYGVLVYDVPLTQRSLYNKLRKKIRKFGIPMTWSVYLIPWGERDMVQAVLDGINSEKPNIISSSIIKFDASEEKKLARAAQDGLVAMIGNAKELMMKRLKKAEENHARIIEQIDKASKTKSIDATAIDQAKAETESQLLYETKKALKHAEDTLEGARRLALAFTLSDIMEAGFMAMEQMVHHKWELLGIKPTVEKEEEVEA